MPDEPYFPNDLQNISFKHPRKVPLPLQLLKHAIEEESTGAGIASKPMCVGKANQTKKIVQKRGLP
jgi:hypothetical protein